MALHIPKAPGIFSMMKDGARFYDGREETVFANIEACEALACTTRSTYGPCGMNKMVINHLGKLFVTKDAATILHELEVAHPAARLMVLATHQQEQEAGDGTNLCLLLAAALLNNALKLVKMGLSVTEIAEGYEKASKLALEKLNGLIITAVADYRNAAEVTPLIRTAIMSKQYGNEKLLGQLIADACITTLPIDSGFSVDNVRVCKILGGGIVNSTVLQGMVFKRDAEGDVKFASDCKIVVYSCPVDLLQTETKGTVLITTGEELKQFSHGEENQMEKHIKDIVDAGCKVIVSGGKVGDLALHYCNLYGLMVIRLNSKFDVKRMCQLTGSTPLPTLTAPTTEECGYVHEVKREELGGTNVVVFRQKGGSFKKSGTVDNGGDDGLATCEGNIATIVVRGATENVLENVEHAIDDGVNTFKSLTKDGRLVVGAGATEMELARQLHEAADKDPGLGQYTMRKFAQSFEAPVKALAENAGRKSTDVIAELYAAHQAGNTKHGLVINAADDGKAIVSDPTEMKIYDPYVTKYWAIRFATTAACTILRVDKIVMSKPAGGPKPKENPGWDN